MDNKITEDIIESLKTCAIGKCDGCIFQRHHRSDCVDELIREAADRLEELNDHSLDATKMVQDDTGRAIMQRAIDTYGKTRQHDKVLEEMHELGDAILHARYVDDDDHGAQQRAISSVIEEIADVEIMIDQLKIMYGERYVNAVRKQKLVRLESRLDDAEKES